MNQRKFVLFIATSLDGYIATEKHSLEWLFAVEGEGDNGISRFYDTVDTILIGRTTYDWIMEQESNNFPYKDKECYVFSRTKKENTEFVTFIQGDVVQFIKGLKNKGGKNIWIVGGGELDYDHGRVEKREYFICNDVSWLWQKDEWEGMSGFGVCVSTVTTQHRVAIDTEGQKEYKLEEKMTVAKNYAIYSLALANISGI